MNLLSVINDDFVDKNFDNIVIRLNKENNKDEIETVYVKDFELIHNGSKLDIEKVFKYPNTIFAKIMKEVIKKQCRGKYQERETK